MNCPKRVRCGDRDFRIEISPERIAGEIERVAREIDHRSRLRSAGEPLLLLCVLKGGVIFCADLLRAIEEPVTVDFIGVSSYGGEMTSGGSLTFTAHPGTEIRGRDVIVVEDIVDSGRTQAGIRAYLQQEGAASVEVASLLHKPTAGSPGTAPEYRGFEIEDRFVIGYGLDYAEQGRQYPAIYVLDEDPVGRPENEQQSAHDAQDSHA